MSEDSDGGDCEECGEDSEAYDNLASQVEDLQDNRPASSGCLLILALPALAAWLW